MVRIDTKRGRDGLRARREPHWYKLSRDRHIGLRKLSEQSVGSWIARYRDEARQRHYKSLGECSGTFDFDAAKLAAETWFRDKEQGVRDRDEEEGPATIATACRAYVRALLGEERREAAQDAHMRFRRTVYGDSNDLELGPRQHKPHEATDPNAPDSLSKPHTRTTERRKPIAHPIATLPLSRVRSPRLKKWHMELVALGLSKASANRTLTALKAALNLAVKNRLVSPATGRNGPKSRP